MSSPACAGRGVTSVAGVIAALACFWPAEAWAQSQVWKKVSVVISKIKVISNLDLLGDEDFRGIVVMNSVEMNSYAAATVSNGVVTPNWEYTKLFQAPGSVSVQIQLYEADSALRFDDDDVTSAPRTTTSSSM